MRSIVLNVEKARVPLKGGASSIPCKNIPSFMAGVLPKSGRVQAVAARAPRPRFRQRTLHKGCRPATGWAKETPPPSLPELRREIDRTYELKGVAAVLGLVRFLAQIVPKCFT